MQKVVWINSQNHIINKHVILYLTILYTFMYYMILYTELNYSFIFENKAVASVWSIPYSNTWLNINYNLIITRQKKTSIRRLDTINIFTLSRLLTWVCNIFLQMWIDGNFANYFNKCKWQCNFTMKVLFFKVTNFSNTFGCTNSCWDSSAASWGLIKKPPNVLQRSFCCWEVSKTTIPEWM